MKLPVSELISPAPFFIVYSISGLFLSFKHAFSYLFLPIFHGLFFYCPTVELELGIYENDAKITQRQNKTDVATEQRRSEVSRSATSNNKVSLTDAPVKSSIRENGKNDAKFSIKELDNGQKYVHVDTDQDIFDDIPMSQMLKTA
ncbi:MAG: hypothetical protein LBS18_03095, partial [Clostridiales bacterium]|nr:hypothetical protein [Clostridiales bacterium]